MIDKDANVNLANSSGWTPLHHAANHGHNDSIKRLLYAKASTTVRNKFGATPLNIAAASGHISTLKLILKEGVIDEEENLIQYPCCPLPLATAALYGNEGVLGHLAEKSPSWLETPMLETHWTPLMFASSIGNYRAVRLLLDSGANSNTTNVLNMTAQDLANDRVKTLLATSTKVSKKRDNTGGEDNSDDDDDSMMINETFIQACKIGDLEAVSELITDYPDLDVNGPEPETGATALMLVAIIGHVDLTKMLIGLGSSLNTKDPVHGWTALMQATFYGQREVAKILLKSGADPTVSAHNGCTALDLATLVEETDTSMIRMLAQETVTIAPPLMSFMPMSSSSRASSAMSRSFSVSALSSAARHQKSSSAKGLKGWLQKVSMRFRRVKKAEKMQGSVSINIIPDEPSFDVQSIMMHEDYEENPYADNAEDNMIFTLGTVQKCVSCCSCAFV